MAFSILDGLGRGKNASVNKHGKLATIAESNLSGHYISVRDGMAFNWISEDDDAAAGDYVFYLQNDDTDRRLFVDLVRVASENASTFKIWEVTGTASAGSAITAKNLNLGSGITQSSNYTARGDGAISGLTNEGSMIAFHRLAANTGSNIPFDDVLILPVGRAIAVEYDAGTTGDCEVLLRGYFLDPDNEV